MLPSKSIILLLLLIFILFWFDSIFVDISIRYTMFGEERRSAQTQQTMGLVPRLVQDLFAWAAASRQQDIVRVLRMSCIQIYNEHVRIA